MTWRIGNPTIYKRDMGLYEILWHIENVQANMTVEHVASTFMQKAARSTLENRVIRCYLLVTDVGYIVIKGVPTSAGLGEELFNNIKRENSDKKPFWAYRFSQRMTGSLRGVTGATNVKMEVRSWKYVAELIKDGLLVGGARRTVENFDPEHKWKNNTLYTPSKAPAAMRQPMGAWSKGPPSGVNKNHTSQRYNNIPPTTMRSNSNCYQCRQLGHFAREYNEKNRSNGKRIGCYRCGEPGHTAKECTNLIQTPNKRGKPYCSFCMSNTHWTDNCHCKES